MSDAEVDRFVKDPSQLVELCRDVVEQLDVSPEGSAVAEQEAQLRAIAKAVEQLERSSVPVPETLRAEKTRLAAALAVHSDAKQALAQLADEFEDILKDLRDRLGQTGVTAEPKSRAPRSRSPKTPQRMLRQHIVQALKKLGGRARVSDVIAQMTVQFEGQLLEGDQVWRESAREPAWQNNAKWERFQMTQEGILKRDSPRGIWELEEGQP